MSHWTASSWSWSYEGGCQDWKKEPNLHFIKFELCTYKNLQLFAVWVNWTRMTQYVKVVARKAVTRLLSIVKNPQAEMCDQRFNFLTKTWGIEGDLRRQQSWPVCHVPPQAASFHPQVLLWWPLHPMWTFGKCCHITPLIKYIVRYHCTFCVAKCPEVLQECKTALMLKSITYFQ